ncbi:PREDICTED: zinc finger protein 862-like [Acropora digitifera]|uniref:zinc finger protein 862-like n=1 Tax=Acropora digitifera TaxID=70779 RepID=UPI00077A1EE3|nr:PREDICTED: zinc finger protein 862-like [Acropora digitifera]
MYCTLCQENGKNNNSFTAGNSNFPTSTLERHVVHSDHRASVLAKSIEGNLVKAVTSALKGREKAVDVAMKAVYWLRKEGIATRKYSSLLSFLELLNTPFVQDLKCGENAWYSSDVIANEMQDAIAEVIRENITKNLQESPCISILVDESTDISVTKMLVIYARLVKLETFKPETRFVTNVHVADGTAATITESITKALNQRNVPLQKVTGLGSDGASVMTSNKEGVTGKLQQLNPKIVNIHCIAHRLQLCFFQAANKVKYLKEFQELLTNIFYYFKKSALQNEKLKAIQEVLNEPKMKYKEIHQVRWLSFYKALETLYLTWDSLVTFFEQEVANKQDKDGKIKGYIKKLTEYDFVASIHMVMDVMPNIMELTLVFQKSDLDCSIIAPAVQACITELTKYRNEELSPRRKTFLQKFVEDTGWQGETEQSEQSRELHFKSHKLVSRGGHTPRESFQTIMNNFLDAVLDNLNTRFLQGSKNIISSFGILSMRPLSFVSTNEESVWGDEELDVLLTRFAKEEAGSPALVNELAARHEWSLLKPLVLKQKYS